MKVYIGPYRKKAERKINIRIDAYDSWNADHTIALIAAPLLKQLQKEKHGAPNVDDEDVPDAIKSVNAKAKETERDVDEFHFDRWEYVLNEIIWALDQVVEDKSDDFYDWSAVPKDVGVVEMMATMKVDEQGLKEYHDRKRKGLMLFGKYYLALWD